VNDPGNDAAHPHTTVVGGYMVDIAFLRDGAIVRPDPAEVRATVEAAIRELERPPTALQRVMHTVWVFSLSANVANESRLALQRRLASRPSVPGAPAAGGAAATAPRATSRFGGNLYDWYDPRTMKAGYAEDPKTEAQRAALLRWAAHSRENGYRLVAVLFPPAESLDDADYFARVRAWLAVRGIEHLDLALLFKERGLRREDLHWRDNGHWHSEGNVIVGKLLAERYP
jgi:hypothetical protein